MTDPWTLTRDKYRRPDPTPWDRICTAADAWFKERPIAQMACALGVFTAAGLLVVQGAALFLYGGK